MFKMNIRNGDGFYETSPSHPIQRLSIRKYDPHPMILIAHRGNTRGPSLEEENKPSYIQFALDEGFYVEVDVRLIDGKLWLGHDEPQYPVDVEFLLQKKLYVHAKTIQTLAYLRQNFPDIVTFFHDTDDCTLTSNGEIWTYPGKELTPISIAVMPENETIPDLLKSDIRGHHILGVCSDYVRAFTSLP